MYIELNARTLLIELTAVLFSTDRVKMCVCVTFFYTLRPTTTKLGMHLAPIFITL